MLEDNRPWEKIPEHMREPLKLYLEKGIEPGGFLRAVLENDLQGAIYRADWINKAELPEIVDFCVWHIPAACWGSSSAVTEWMEWQRKRRMDEASQQEACNA